MTNQTMDLLPPSRRSPIEARPPLAVFMASVRARAALALALAALLFARNSRGQTANAAPLAASVITAPPTGEFPFVRVGSDGLGEVSAWQMAQDSVGYIWIAADTGVYRFDGRHATRQSLAEGLPAPYVTQIAIGRGDTVWCVTSRGLARLRDGAWAAMWQRSPGVGAESVRRIATDPAGRFWATTPRGVVRERDDGDLELDPSWRADDPDALFIDADGAMMVGTRGVLQVREADGSLRMLGGAAGDGVPSERIYSAGRDGLGRVWISSTSGIFLLERGASRFRPWASFQGSETFIHLDRARRPWFASESGLYYADDASVRHRVEGLPTDLVGGIYEDREGSLWAAGLGIFRLAGHGLWRVHFERDGLPENTIWSVQRALGELWVGTQRGLAHAVSSGPPGAGGSAGGGGYGSRWLAVDAVPKEPIRSIVPSGTGALWLSGPPGHVFRYDPRAGTTDTFDASHGIPDARTVSMAVDRDGAAWVGTVEGGLVKSVGAGKALRFVPVALEGDTRPATVREMLTDRRGRFWIASDRGLFVQDGGARRRYTAADGLKADAVTYMVERRSGEMCVAYAMVSGVTCFRADEDALGAIAHFDANGALVSDVVFILGEDARSRLWIGTNTGVHVLDGAHVLHFDALDGMPSYDCDARAFWPEENGDVWVGTSRGLGQFLGQRYDGPPQAPNVALTALREGESGAMGPLATGDRIPYARRAVEFQFSALSFLHEHAMEYETRMLGAGGTWKRATSDHTRYDALSPDRYELQVRARHPAGEWGPLAVARFAIAPPWWQTWWFRASAVGAAAFALFALSRWRSAALKRKNRDLEALVASRTQELAAAHADVARSEKLSALGRMLAQLSHELNNPMNVVANNVTPLKEYVAEMTAMLVAFREARGGLPDGGRALGERWDASELDFVLSDAPAALQVIDVAAQRVRKVQSDLAMFLRGESAQKEVGDLNEDLRTTVQMVSRALPVGVSIEATYGALPPVAYESGRMNQVFLNLLQNAVDALRGRGGTISLRTYDDIGAVCVEVADDGPGIPASVREHVFEPFFTTKALGKGTGLGLSICRQIVVDQHGGAMELVDRAGKGGEGAVFVVTLPAVRG